MQLSAEDIQPFAGALVDDGLGDGGVGIARRPGEQGTGVGRG